LDAGEELQSGGEDGVKTLRPAERFVSKFRRTGLV